MTGEWSMSRLNTKMTDDTDWIVDELSSLFDSKFWEETMRKTKPLTRKKIDKMLDKWFNDEQRWTKYRGVTAFFAPLDYIKNMDARLIASLLSGRLAMDIELRGGHISHALTEDVTHVVCVVREDIPMSALAICRSLGISEEESMIVRDGGPFVLSHKWVEESLDQHIRLPEEDFLLPKEVTVESSKIPTPTPPSSPIYFFGAAQFEPDAMDT